MGYRKRGPKPKPLVVQVTRGPSPSPAGRPRGAACSGFHHARDEPARSPGASQRPGDPQR